MENNKIHRFLAGNKLGHKIRQLRDLCRKEVDDPLIEEAKVKLNLAERSKLAGDWKCKSIATISKGGLMKLCQDIGKHVTKQIPYISQRAVWKGQLRIGQLTSSGHPSLTWRSC